jgi:hypothetical protein
VPKSEKCRVVDQLEPDHPTRRPSTSPFLRVVAHRDNPDGRITLCTIAAFWLIHIFRHLELFTPEVLEAWFQLFKTGRPEHFATLMQAVQSQRP